MTVANRIRNESIISSTWRDTKPTQSGYFKFRFRGMRYMNRRLYNPNRDPWEAGWEWLDEVYKEAK
jgi:hypothetical protein